jgi:hypothetical protein
MTILVLISSPVNTTDLIPPAVQPGDTIENETVKDIYIILKLKPGQTFTNSSPDTALVYSESDFIKRFYDHRMHFRLEKFEELIEIDRIQLQSLNDDITRVKGKHKKEK